MTRWWRPVLLLVLGAAPVAVWWYLLVNSNSGVDFGVGSIQFPTRITSSLNGMFMGVAVGAVAFWRVAVGLAWPGPEGRFAREWRALPERTQVLLFSFLAFALAALTRSWVLRHAPLTDDEGAYTFSALLLKDGRLWWPSAPPELKLFFDNIFIINDGKMYSQYPLGWPALLAVALATGTQSLVNPLLSALTVPAVYGLGKHLGGRATAQWAAVLFLCSPMISTTAATLLSHTSAMAAVAWLLFIAHTRVDDRSPRWDALLALLLGVAVFIRPTVGVGFGAPVAAWWLWRRAWQHREGAAARLGGFVLVGLALGGLFLAVNAAQTGSPWKLAYQRSLEYARENQWRFSAWRSEMKFMADGGFKNVLEVAFSTLLRLNADLFGLPLSLAPLMAVAWARRHAVLAVSCVVFTVLHLFAHDVGVDTFAPVHFFELAAPLVVLSAEGLRRLAAESRAVLSVVVAFFLVAVATLIPMRLWTLHLLAQDVLATPELLEEKHVENAVVFTATSPLQCTKFSRHFVFGRPVQHPALTDDVVWANHLTIERDRALMSAFPGRTGYVLMQDIGCNLQLVPLASPEAGKILPSPHLSLTTP